MEYIKDSVMKKKTERKLQRKATTIMKKEKLENLKGDVPTLQGIIIHTENIIALQVFNVEIPRQSIPGNFGSKETLFGWHR